MKKLLLTFSILLFTNTACTTTQEDDRSAFAGVWTATGTNTPLGLPANTVFKIDSEGNFNIIPNFLSVPGRDVYRFEQVLPNGVLYSRARTGEEPAGTPVNIKEFLKLRVDGNILKASPASLERETAVSTSADITSAQR